MRIAFLLVALLLACSGAGASRQQVAPDNDVDVTAGWNAYRASDQARAVAHYRKAADRNNRVAQFNLAVMLLAGEGTTADPWSGVGWLRRSAELGFAQAQFALGLLYERGEHVTRSQDEATAWFRKAAEQD
ncbi:MAG: sel1 repeat family protein, partial [Pseudomonadota bacterium]|nr:sel1 repeat family protein [Pseudomonadota bacterium]